MKKNIQIIVSIHKDIKPLIPGFLESKKESIKKIKAFLAQNDLPNLRDMIHKFIGSWGTYGFKDLSKLSLEMELALKHENIGEFKQLLKTMEEYLATMQLEYK